VHNILIIYIRKFRLEAMRTVEIKVLVTYKRLV